MLCDDRDHVKYTVEALFGGSLFEGTKERWGFYKAYDLEFPSDEELRHLKGFIIPGAKYAAYDTSIPWIEPLKALVKKIYEHYPHIKMVGVCFGHQLLAQALGGKAERMPHLDTEQRPLYIGRETIEMKDSFFDLPYV